jgi:TRAP transporter TAXI family solute receptor
MAIPETIKTYGLIALVIVASFWFAARFIEPPPPKNIVFAAGSSGGEYFRYAQLYKKSMAEEGIIVDVLETAGSSENAALLAAGKADIAFIQSGLKSQANENKIETLSSLYYEPLWVFTRTADPLEKDLQALKGARIAVGAQGSGTKAIATQLLALNNLADDVVIHELSGKEAVEALKNNTIDAAFFVARPNTSYIQELLHEEDIHLLSFARAQSYTRLFAFLSHIYLHEGVIDMAANIPQESASLISPVAQLTARSDFNGALKTLVLSTAIEVHNKGDIFSDKGTFPSLRYADFTPAEEAVRYFKYGPSFLQRFLPFWLADMINRMVVMLIPLLGVMFPLLKIASPTYRWRTRSKIYRWYKSLKKMEENAVAGESDLKEVLGALERIDMEVKKTQVPLSYADELYNLRVHIQMIKNHLQKNT